MPDMKNIKINIIVFIIILLLSVHAHAGDWAQFRGPNRDGISDETGLLKKWPDQDPKMLWSAPDLGDGYSSAAIAGKLIYVTGLIDDEIFISAFDLNGKLKWKTPCGPGWDRSYPGTRTTPTVNDGAVALVEAGKNFKIISSFNITKGKGRHWAHPSISNGRLYIRHGNYLMAFDIKDKR